MAIPSKAIGAGNIDAAEVFKVTFSQALSTAPKLEAWDNSETFPAVDSEGTTTEKEIFFLQEQQVTVMFQCWQDISVDKAVHQQDLALWHPSIQQQLEQLIPNLLVGSTNYVQADFTPASGEENFVFNPFIISTI